MKNKNPDTDKRLGIMYGVAYGDALGRPLEFITEKTLDKLGTPFRKQVGINRPQQGRVTDDTQMSIAVARAVRVKGRPNADHLTESLVREFIRWDRDPKSHEGGRAPGMTCLSATRKLRAGKPWILATDADSKGNGANMRVSPLALRTDWTWNEMGAVAQLQAAITHGHATALAASHLTAAAVRMLLEGVAQPNGQFIDHLIAYCWDQRERYYVGWLGHLWQAKAFGKPEQGRVQYQLPLAWWDDAASKGPTSRQTEPEGSPAPSGRGPVQSPEEFIARGWDKMIDCLEGIRVVARDPLMDPCRVGGEGWVAEEALTVALHTLLCFKGDPANALRRAAFTRGDSDSIASITGALCGAAYGLKAFPSHWRQNIEYRLLLEDLTESLSSRC